MSTWQDETQHRTSQKQTLMSTLKEQALLRESKEKTRDSASPKETLRGTSKEWSTMWSPIDVVLLLPPPDCASIASRTIGVVAFG